MQIRDLLLFSLTQENRKKCLKCRKKVPKMVGQTRREKVKIMNAKGQVRYSDSEVENISFDLLVTFKCHSQLKELLVR
jgi:hypothetical protein